MNALELKIPPPLLALILAAAMWVIAQFTPLFEVETFVRRLAAAVVSLAGGGFSLFGAIACRRARTTVNSKKLQSTSSLVSSGIYRITRNPMYVGLLFVLAAWTLFLSAPWTLLGPVAFVLYMNRFQIEPEERMLLQLFGETYAEYGKKVRRWL